MIKSKYPILLIKQEEEGYLVRFPDFPEAITQGEDKKEALLEAADCLEEAIANRIIKGLDIPKSKYPFIASFHDPRGIITPEVLLSTDGWIYRLVDLLCKEYGTAIITYSKED